MFFPTITVMLWLLPKGGSVGWFVTRTAEQPLGAASGDLLTDSYVSNNIFFWFYYHLEFYLNISKVKPMHCFKCKT